MSDQNQPSGPSHSVPVPIQSLSPGGESGAVPHISAAVSAPVPVPVYEESFQPNLIPHVEITPAKPENVLQQYWRKVGGGSLLVSLLIHAGILIGAVFIVQTIIVEPKVDFLPGGGSKEGQAAEQQLSQQVQAKKRSSISKSTPMRKVVSNSATATINLPDVPIDTMDMPEMSSMLSGGAMGSGGFSNMGSGGGFGKGTGIGGQAGFISLPATMKSRCSTAERLAKLKESGGTPECEKAVSTALEWLKTKQNADGSWGRTHKAGMTGLALLCYLGRCETPDSTFYGENVMKGILYLIELSKSNEYGIISTKPEHISSAYEHGIATYALGEMYTLARMGSKSLPGMREAFENGVKVIIENQHANGSWHYYGRELAEKKPSGGSDLSVTGWQYQALKAAKFTGLNIKGLHNAINKAVDYLESTQTKDGGFGGTDREKSYNQWSLSGTAMLGIQTLGKPKASMMRKGMDFSLTLFKEEPPDWGKNGNLYNWYYYAQAFFQNGGEEWKYWNTTALPQILGNQLPNGSWKPAGDESHGAGGDAEIYRVMLSTLMLEVYYRYLKVGDKEERSILTR